MLIAGRSLAAGCVCVVDLSPLLDAIADFKADAKDLANEHSSLLKKAPHVSIPLLVLFVLILSVPPPTLRCPYIFVFQSQYSENATTNDELAAFNQRIRTAER
jgi:hypothetical protein